MAEGFAKKFGEGVLEVYSAGSRPSGKVNPEAIKVVKEASINISSYKSKGFNELPVKCPIAITTATNPELAISSAADTIKDILEVEKTMLTIKYSGLDSISIIQTELSKSPFEYKKQVNVINKVYINGINSGKYLFFRVSGHIMRLCFDSM